MSPFWPWRPHPQTDLREVYVERPGRWLRLQARRLEFIRAEGLRWPGIPRYSGRPDPVLDAFVSRLWRWAGIGIAIAAGGWAAEKLH